MSRHLRHLFPASPLLLLAACVLPPTLEPKYLAPEEVTLLGHAQRGKQYALSGRPELAEREFREAIRLSPQRSSFYNDLGFVLQSGDRHDEAMAAFRHALMLDPAGLSPRVNLARSLHRAGRLHEAITMLKEVVEIYARTGPDEVLTVSTEEAEAEEPDSLEQTDDPDELEDERYAKRRTAKKQGKKQPGGLETSFTKRDLVAVYQNIAFLHSLLGFDDDAICYAGLAVDQGDPIFGPAEYGRFLLSLGRVPAARDAFSGLFSGSPAGVPAKVTLDYGITLLLTSQREQALAAFTRVEEDETADSDTRLYAGVLASSLIKQSGPPEKAEAQEAVLLEDRGLCENWHGVRIGYWPLPVAEEMESTARGYCGEDAGRPKEKSFFGGGLFEMFRSNSA
jgi:tetratricopeptide (TPR) repeat protein